MLLLTETTPDLSRLALDKKIYSAVLLDKNAKEGRLKLEQVVVIATGHRNGSDIVGSGVFFDVVLDFIVINVIWPLKS